MSKWDIPDKFIPRHLRETTTGAVGSDHPPDPPDQVQGPSSHPESRSADGPGYTVNVGQETQQAQSTSSQGTRMMTDTDQLQGVQQSEINEEGEDVVTPKRIAEALKDLAQAKRDCTRMRQKYFSNLQNVGMLGDDEIDELRELLASNYGRLLSVFERARRSTEDREHLRKIDEGFAAYEQENDRIRN